MIKLQHYYLLLGILLVSSLSSNAQQVSKDTISRTATIVETIDSNKVQFTAKTPELRQIAGAPQAYYSNFWEFGDGHYSTDNNPTHTYKEKGNYSVRLSTTNNYDDGLPPTSRPKSVSVSSISFSEFEDENKHLLENHHGFRLLNDREPAPNQKMQFVVSYGNEKEYTTQGKLYVFFNEAKYKNKNFNLIDIRTYHGETEIDESEVIANSAPINPNEFLLTSGFNDFPTKLFQETDTIHKYNLPATLENAKKTYQDFKVWEFGNLQPEEKRNLFLTFQTTPEMLKDTTAVISVRSIYIPEKGGDIHQIRTKEMEIVTSHDPNKMAVYNTRLNYRLVRFKRLKYKVRFQNNGEGPARLIKLNVDIPEMLDKSTLKVIDMYPKVPICPDGKDVQYSCLDTIRMKDKISFQFKNIYLPGSNQKGVHEKDSTKGFVKYSLKFGKDFHKVRSKSRTAIIFDKNEPIITNVATSRFSPGLSIGARIGYNLYFTKDKIETMTISSATEQINTTVHKDIHSYSLGATFSPYKSYKWYYQGEVIIDRQNSEAVGSFKYVHVEDATNLQHAKQSFLELTKQTNILFIPASLRYNINSVFSLGTGVQVNFRMKGTKTKETEERFFHYNPDRPEVIGEEIIDRYSKESQNTDLDMQLYDYMPFVDFTFGVSRIGPSLGVRYLHPLKQEHRILQLYAVWKF